MKRIKLKLKTVLLLPWTVLLLISTATAMSNSFANQNTGMEELTGGTTCPPGTVFCMQSAMCVNENPSKGPCPDSPTCSTNQVTKWTNHGYQECKEPLAECGGRDYVCKENGAMNCVDYGQCRRVEVSITLALAYDEFAEHGLDYAIQHYMTELSSAMGINVDEIWLVETWPHYEYGSTELVFNAPLEADGNVEAFFTRRDAAVTAIQGWTVQIDWYLSWMHTNDGLLPDPDVCPNGMCDNGQFCRPDEVFCFETRQCVKTDGSCKELECHGSTKKCHLNGRLECIDEWTVCEYAEVGGDDGHEDSEGITCTSDEVFCFETRQCVKTDGSCKELECPWPTKKCHLNGRLECIDEWTVCEYAEVIIFFEFDFWQLVGGYSYVDYENQKKKIIEEITQITGAANSDMFWDVALWSEHNKTGFYCKAFGDLLANINESIITQGNNSIYDVYGTKLLIDWDASYAWSSHYGVTEGCPYNQVNCFDEEYDDFQCIEEDVCMFAEIFLRVEVQYHDLVGLNYQYYEPARDGMVNQITQWVGENRTLVWDSFLYEDGGYTVLYGRIPLKLYESLVPVFGLSDKHLYNTSGYEIRIMWNDSQLVPPHTVGGDDGHEDSEGITCTSDEVFCFETRQCVKTDGSCKELECPWPTKKCHLNGRLECIDEWTVCEYAEVIIFFEFDFWQLVGGYSYVDYENQKKKIIEEITQITGAANSDMFWDVALWSEHNKTGFYCKAFGDLLANINESIITQGNNSIYDVYGTKLLIDWDASYAWSSHYGVTEGCPYNQVNCFDEEYDDFQCIEEDVCMFAEIFLRVEVQYHDLVGLNYQYYEPARDGMVNQITQWVGENRTLVWDSFLYEDGGYTVLYGRIPLKLYESLVPVFGLSDKHLYNTSGYEIRIMWNDSQLVPPHTVGGDDGHEDSEGITCTSDEVFCFETRQCVKTDGSCKELECPWPTKKCHLNGRLECIDEWTVCEYAEVIIFFEFDFWQLVGGYSYVDYENQKKKIIEEITQITGAANSDMFWDVALWSEHNKTGFYCKAFGDLLANINESIITQGNNSIYDVYGTKLLIDWDASYAWSSHYGVTEGCPYNQVNCFDEEYDDFQCIEEDVCMFAEIFLRVEVQYHDLVGLNYQYYEPARDGMVNQITQWVGENRTLVWDSFLYEDGGYTVLYGRIPLKLYESLVPVFGLSDKHLYNTSGYEIRIMWNDSQLVPPHTVGGDGHEDSEGITCTSDEVFCFETRQCVKTDGSCKELECPWPTKKCHLNGRLECIDEWTVCEYAEVIIFFEFDFWQLVGGYSYVDYENQKKKIIEEITQITGAANSDMFWDVALWSEHNKTGFYCKAFGDLLANINESIITQGNNSIYDVYGTKLLIDWDASYAWSSHYGVTEGCPYNQVNCFDEEYDDFQCIEEDVCMFAEIFLRVEVQYHDLVGLNYQYYEPARDGMVNQITQWVGENRTLVWDSFLYEDGGYTVLYGRIPLKLYESLVPVFGLSDKHLYNTSGYEIRIMWNDSQLVPPHTVGGDGHEDSEGITCTSDEVFCFETRQCVKTDGSCKELECPWPTKKCHLNGRLECIDEWTVCEYAEVGGDDGHEDSEGITCTSDEVFCFETRQCVKTDGSCKELECPWPTKKCHLNGRLECIDEWTVCEYAEVIIFFEFDFWQLVGGYSYVDYENQKKKIIEEITQITGAANSDMFWDVALWSEHNKTGFYCKAFGDLLANINESIITQGNNSIYDVYGTKLLIDWDASYAWSSHYGVTEGCPYNQVNCFDEEYDDFQCIEEDVCMFAEIFLRVEVQYHDLVGLNYQYYEPARDGMVNQITQWVGENRTLVWDSFLYEDGGYTVLYGRIPLKLYESLVPLFDSSDVYLYNTSGYIIGIIWVDSHLVPPHTVGGVGHEDGEGIMCTSDQVFCFEKAMCVSAEPMEAPCLDKATCSRNEVSQLTYNGQEECVDFRTACGGREHVCMENGTLYCVDYMQCGYVELSLALDILYDSLAEYGHEEVIQQFIVEVPSAMGIDVGEMWLVEMRPHSDYGFTELILNVHLDEEDRVVEFFKRQDPSFILQEGAVIIYWTSSWMYTNDPHSVIVDSHREVYTLSTPVVKDTQLSILIENIIPGSVFDYFPDEATLNCSGTSGVTLKTGSQPSFSGISVINKFDEITFQHTLTESQFIKCEIVMPSEVSGDTEYFIGFLAIPEEISQLGEITNIHGKVEEIEILEDSTRTHLPENLFSVRTKGDDLAEDVANWTQIMTDENEMWYNAETSTMNVSETVAFDVYKAKIASMSIFRVTALTDADTGIATLFYKGEPMSDTQEVAILINASNIALEVKPNYHGEFNLSFEAVGSDWNFVLPVVVLDRPDAPEPLVNVDLSEVIEAFAYTAHTDYIPVYKVEDIVSAKYSDADGDAIGMLLLGSVNNSLTAEGTWEYTVDSGESWILMEELDDTSEPSENITAVRLGENDSLRFTPYSSSTWLVVNAPAIAFTVFEYDGEITSGETVTIPITQCSALSDGITKYCGMFESGEFAFVKLPLASYGCDGIFNSGLIDYVCGCGDQDSCEDCAGVPNGDSYMDECGICNGGFEVVNCSDATCRENRLTYCEEKENAEAALNSICGEGSDLNPDFQTCGELCVPDGESYPVDRCGVTCGDNSCVDCMDIANGQNQVDPCDDQCKDPSALNNSCLYIIEPQFSMYSTVDYIIVGVPPTIALDNFECSLQHYGSSSETVVTPTVTATTFMIGEDGIKMLELLLSQSLEERPSIGSYVVNCTEGQVSLYTGNLYTVYDLPVLTSIMPSARPLDILQETEMATVYGTGFINTGSVVCAVSCAELGLPCLSYRGAEGKWVSEEEVKCPVGLLKSFQRAQEYHVSVVLNAKDVYVLDSTSISNSVEFKITGPVPQPVSAVLSKHGCNKMEVTFDMPVAIDDDDITKCSNFMAPIDDTATCFKLPSGFMVEYDEVIDPGKSFTFLPGKIRYAGDLTDSATYMSGGTVNATREELDESETPSVYIDDTADCKGVLLKPVIKNKGCWDELITWAVHTNSSDSLLSEGLIDPASGALDIPYSKLQNSVSYTFTMNYTIGSESGSVFKELTKIQELTSVTIKGRSILNPTKGHKFKAEVRACGTVSKSAKILWYRDKQPVGTGQRLQMEAGSLSPERTYTLSCHVVLGSSETVTTHNITTTEKNINAEVIYKGLPQDYIEVGQDLEVSCGVKNDIIAEGYTCIWSCVPDDFGGYPMVPCVEFKVTGASLWNRTGNTITLPSVNASASGASFVHRYQLTMLYGKLDSTTEFTVRYDSPSELIQPEIRTKGSDSYIIGVKKRVTLKARSRCATRCTWMENDGENNWGIPLPVEDYTKVYPVFNLTYNNITFQKCNIKLDFTDAELIPGQDYYAQLTVYNIDVDNYSMEKKWFTFKIDDPPKAGTVEVSSLDGTAVALSSEFKISMIGWSHEDDFNCYAYSSSTSDPETRDAINTLPTSPGAGIPLFSLPEGEFSIGVECCNDYGCASASASQTISVEAPESVDIMDMLLYTLPSLVKIQFEMLMTNTLPLVANLIDTVDEAAYTSSELQTAQSVFEESVNVAITSSMAFVTDGASMFVVLQHSVHLTFMCPGIVYTGTMHIMQIQAVSLAKQATGNAVGSSRRRKRSITSSSSPTGLSKENAQILLETFDATVSDPLTSTEAETFLEAIDEIMVGMCQQFDGLSPWEAPANVSYIKVYGTNMSLYDTTLYDVSSDAETDSEITPAKILFGTKVSSMYSDEWICTVYVNCSDVCLSTAILAVDIFSPTVGVTTSTRMSDILVVKIINPETYAAESISNLANPVEVTLILEGTVDMEDYDYKCLMFVSTAWDADLCTATTPEFDSESNQYSVVCSCTSIGTVAVFQELKSEFETTSSTTITTTEATTTTTLPFVSISPTTNYVILTFTFYDDYLTYVIDEAVFISIIKQQMAAYTSFLISVFRNMIVEQGSIIVTFEVHDSGSDYTLGQMVYVLEEMVASGNITFTSSNGTTLTLNPSSFGYLEKQYTEDEGDSDEGSSNTGVIVGAVIGAIVIVVLIVVIIILVLKQKGVLKIGNNPSIPKGPPPRYEIANSSFGMPAPPPYLYEDPVRVSQADKWIENEVEKKVTEITERDQVEDRPSSSDRCKSAGLRSIQGEKVGLPSVSSN